MTKKAIIAGGGSGGHIYPAIAMAKAIQAKDSKVEIHFVGSPLGMETELVPKAGFPLHLVRVGRLNKNVGILERLVTLMLLPWAFLKSLFLLIYLRPIFVLGVGGYASAPIMLVASFLRIRTFIWEANAYPGMANRLLSQFVDECLVVFEESKQILKSRTFVNIGMPVRKEIEETSISSTPHSGLNILIFGGSQGARGINNAVSKAVAQSGEWVENVSIVHQTGKGDFERINKLYADLKNAGSTVQVESHAFLNDMEKRYAWADFVISRAGISTVAELAAVGKASLLVPYPHAADNHQQKNADVLVRAKSAMCLSHEQFTADAFKKLVIDLKNNPESVDQMSKNIKKFHVPRAADQIAKHVLESVNKKLINELNV